jgi:ABC-2 type transport system ATP-binding protein
MFMAAAVEIEDLEKSFSGVPALRGVSFEVPAGTVFGLLGPNGAGKTTIVRILSTLERPDAGRASVSGYDVVSQASSVRKVIGLAGQYPAVDDDISGYENLYLIGRLHNLAPRAAKSRANDLLELFGLAGAGRRGARGYSGGMRRRLDLAASLLGRPSVVYLDEPTTGLDPQVRLEIHSLISELRDAKRTILITTHYIEEAERLCDRVAIIDQGRIIALGSPREIQAKTLGTSRVEIHTAQPMPVDVPKFQDAEKFVMSEDRKVLNVYSARPARTLPDLVKWIDQNGLDLEDIHLKRPTLEDVFIELTGKKLRD